MNFTDLRIMKTQERLQNALLELLETNELKAITVKEICDRAGISRNAFYQHYAYKEDLYDQMVAQATEEIRNSLTPVIPDISHLSQDSINIYAQHVIDGIIKVKDLIYVMLKNDDGIFLKQLTDLVFRQFITDATQFFNIKDSKELRLFYGFLSAGMASFIIKWILEDDTSEDKAVLLLSDILCKISIDIPMKISDL